MNPPPQNNSSASWQSLVRQWLRPGLGIKRWMLTLLLAMVAMGVAITFLVVEIYQGGWLPGWLYALSLQWFPRPVRAILLFIVAIPLLWYSLRELKRNFFQPLQPIQQQALSLVTRNRKLSNGPRIVAIGGGTGLSTLLRGLKKYTANITAIVTVADDGGSSGRLRSDYGMLPPGDLRNCLAALADDESLITQLFQYRFGGEGDIGGHSFGNLFLTAMTGVTGSFDRALVESGRVLAIQGQVLPASLENLTLCAEYRPKNGGRVIRVRGESAIPTTDGKIQRVFLEPHNVAAFPSAIQAILSADVVVAGPGSLFTSIIPNLLVPDITAALLASSALRVLVVNTATQPGETDQYAVADHVAAVEKHTQYGIFPLVLANDNQSGAMRPNLEWVATQPSPNGFREVILADLADDARPWRHSSEKLAREIMNLYQRANQQSQTPIPLQGVAQIHSN